MPNSNLKISISYRGLRTAVGLAGMLLPLVLVIGGCILCADPCIESAKCAGGLLNPEAHGCHDQCQCFAHSVSSYYHTIMRDVFVGTMCATGLFLCFYTAEIKYDRILGWIAGLSAIAVALFPVTHECCNSDCVGWTHNIAAVIFFASLIFYSAVIFPIRGMSESDVEKLGKIDRHGKRRALYYVCAIIMTISVVFVVLYETFADQDHTLHLTLWGETLALVAFGISWLVKGQRLFKDK